MRESPLAFNDFAAREFKGRVSEPGCACAHNFIICDCANTEQNVFGQVLASGYDNVITKKRVSPESRLSKRDCPAMNIRAAKIYAISEKTLRAYFDQLRDRIKNGRDFAAATNLHSGHPQPDGPEQRAAEPIPR